MIAGGQEGLKESIIRIGHMGFVSERDVDEVMEALADVMGALTAI